MRNRDEVSYQPAWDLTHPASPAQPSGSVPGQYRVVGGSGMGQVDIQDGRSHS